jgi:2-polyprenyl-3-methyl-5-hydroxy-6-metoxy-1,4-benzoquinol methylase
MARLRRRIRAGVMRLDLSIPSLPDDQIQASFVGRSGAATMWEAFSFYQLIKRRCRELGRPLSPASRLLDFGCGWGRIIRLFFKDVPGDHLVGVDVDPAIVGLCTGTLTEGRYATVNPSPPTELSDASFDVIYAYSVFSHLAEDVHLQWVREFARLLKPGGLVFATTQKRSFIEFCNRLTEADVSHPWHSGLRHAFRPLEATLAKYDAGDFVYSPTGGGGVRETSFYGEAVVSERYVDRHWQPHLTKVAFDDSDPSLQAVIIAQKPLVAGRAA